jgi:hypothetical protein
MKYAPDKNVRRKDGRTETISLSPPPFRRGIINTYDCSRGKKSDTFDKTIIINETANIIESVLSVKLARKNRTGHKAEHGQDNRINDTHKEIIVTDKEIKENELLIN